MLDFFNKLPLWLLIAFSSGFTILADILAKYWSINPEKTVWLVVAGLIYCAGAFVYMPTLLKESLIVTSVLWTLLSTGGFILAGLFLFDEKLSNWQLMGLIFGIISLLFFVVAER